MSRPNSNLVFDVFDEVRMILSMAKFANLYNCCKCSRQIPERILQLLVTLKPCMGSKGKQQAAAVSLKYVEVTHAQAARRDVSQGFGG